MEKEDYIADIDMYFKQILGLCNLILESTGQNEANLVTLQGLVESASGKFDKLSDTILTP